MNQQQIIADFRRRYEGTYVFVKFPNEKEDLFHVDSIEESESTVGIINVSSDEYGKLRLNYATDHSILFKYPPVGVFQHNDQAYMFRRIPAKQYARGLCSGNSEIKQVAHFINGSRNQINYPLVKSAFNRASYSLAMALQMLGTGKYRSVALHRNYALMLSPTAKEGLLLTYFDCPIAWVDHKGGLLAVLEETFANQIKQVLDNANH